MITTLGDIKTEVLVELNQDTTSAFYTDTILNQWAKKAATWAQNYKKWPFTEGRASTTWAGSEEIPYFEGWRPDSIRLLQIGDKAVQKLNFADYKTFRENYPSNNNRYYTDYARTVFVNPNIDLSGTLTAYGQYTPAAMDGSDPTSVTVFSSIEEEGNEAIVQEMLSYAKMREQNENEAQFHHNKAVDILNQIWGRYTDEQFGYQSRNGDGMFKRFDAVRGGFPEDVFNRDRFY